jgi:hypothetical protein
MLTIVEMMRYDPIVGIYFVLGIIALIIAMSIVLTAKKLDFVTTLLGAVIIVLVLGSSSYVFVTTTLSTEQITPCSISENHIADTNGNIYYVNDIDILKMHINQTREVIISKGWVNVIVDIPGTVCPSGIPAGC